MAKSVSFRWEKRPSEAIGRKLQQNLARLKPALETLAAMYAARGEALMKDIAEWNDRTAYARGSLFGRSEGLAIFLGTVNEAYGLFLELGTSRMRAFPTIRPALEQIGADYFRDAVALTGATLFGG